MKGGPERAQGVAASELRRRVADIVRLRMLGQPDAMLQYFAPDVVLHYNCTKEGLFRPAIWVGHDAFRENIRRTDIDYEPKSAEVIDILVEGESTVVRWRSRWSHRATGHAAVLDMAHFLHWKNGRIVKMFEFLDYHDGAARQAPSIGTLEELLSPKSPGLTREQINRRARLLGDFPNTSPNVAQFRRICSPDIVCEFVGDRARIPYSGRRVGIDALASVVRSIRTEFEQINSTISELMIDGGRVACRRTVEWRHRGTGRHGLVELADFARFEDGLIVEIIEFRDSITLLELQGDMEQR